METLPPQTPSAQDEVVLKPKKQLNLSDEERQRRSDRMKALAKSRNDLLKKQKAERIVTEDTPAPTPAVGAFGAPAPIPEPTPAPAPPKEKKTPKKKEIAPAKPVTKKLKRVVVVASSDSDSQYGDTDSSSGSEDEVVYVAKRSSKRGESNITKPKREGNTKSRPATPSKAPSAPVPDEPQIKVKFF